MLHNYHSVVQFSLEMVVMSMIMSNATGNRVNLLNIQMVSGIQSFLQLPKLIPEIVGYIYRPQLVKKDSLVVQT